MRSANVSAHLTETDAIEIWRRRFAGEAQHVLAAEYKVNQGRIADILSGRRFPNARSIAVDGNPHFTEHKENKMQRSLPLDGSVRGSVDESSK